MKSILEAETYSNCTGNKDEQKQETDWPIRLEQQPSKQSSHWWRTERQTGQVGWRVDAGLASSQRQWHGSRNTAARWYDPSWWHHHWITCISTITIIIITHIYIADVSMPLRSQIFSLHKPFHQQISPHSTIQVNNVFNYNNNYINYNNNYIIINAEDEHKS